MYVYFIIQCWATAEGFKCCSPNTPVVLTDSKGKWGIENNDWCGIIESKNSSSVSIKI